MHQQEEPGQVPDAAGERDQNIEGGFGFPSRGQRSKVSYSLLTTTVVFPLQELKHDNIVALLDFQVGDIIAALFVVETWSAGCRLEIRRHLLLQQRLTFQL